MKFDNILTASKKFERFVRNIPQKKTAQKKLTNQAIEKIIIDTYIELSVAPPDDIRIQYQATGEGSSYHSRPKYYNVIIWSNSYLEPTADSTIQGRLHAAFDPNYELYNFYMKYFNSDE